MAVTPNIGLTEPVQGTTPWDAIVNGNMTIIDNCFGSTQTVPSLALSGTLTKVNGVATVGQGIAPILAVTSQKTETAADSALLTFTPPAVAGTYRLTFICSVSAAAGATLGWTASWTDSNGNLTAPANLSLFQMGVAAPALTFTTSSAADYYGSIFSDVNNSGSNIVIKFTLTAGTVTAKVTALIERMI